MFDISYFRETILFCFFSFSFSFLLHLVPPSFSWLHQRWGLFISVLLLILELFLRGGRRLMVVSFRNGKSRNPNQLWTGEYYLDLKDFYGRNTWHLLFSFTPAHLDYLTLDTVTHYSRYPTPCLRLFDHSPIWEACFICLRVNEW